MIETIRTLIVDDEPPARRKLKRWLDAHPRFEVVAEAGDDVIGAQHADDGLCPGHGLGNGV